MRRSSTGRLDPPQMIATATATSPGQQRVTDGSWVISHGVNLTLTSDLEEELRHSDTMEMSAGLENDGKHVVPDPNQCGGEAETGDQGVALAAEGLGWAVVCPLNWA